MAKKRTSRNRGKRNGAISYMIVFLALTLPSSGRAEVFQLKDGRSVDLKSDGTYEFLEGIDHVNVIASDCKSHASERVDKDDFGEIEGYSYFVGFSLRYKIENNTKYRLSVRQLGTEFSKDYGFFYTLLETPNFSDAIEPGDFLIMNRDNHLFRVVSDRRYNDMEIDDLIDEYGCSEKNLSGQKMFLDVGETMMEFGPEGDCLSPLDLLEVESEVNGLDFIAR